MVRKQVQGADILVNQPLVVLLFVAKNCVHYSKKNENNTKSHYLNVCINKEIIDHGAIIESGHLPRLPR